MFLSSTNTFTIVLALLANGAHAWAPAGVPVEFQMTVPQSDVLWCLASSNANGAPVTVINCESTFPSGHQWTVDKGGAKIAPTIGPSGQIRIFGGKCLDVTNGLDQNGNKLQVWDCGTNGNPNQQFTVNGDGSIRWSANGGEKCVDLSGGKVTSGNQIQIWDCSEANQNQKWNAVPVPLLAGEKIHWNPNGTSSTSCLTAASSKPGSQITIGTCTTLPSTSQANNTWSVPASGEGPLATFNEGLCLDVKDGKNVNGNPVQVWTCVAGSSNQLWISSRNSQGTIVQWAGTNKCLDVTGGKTGSALQIWTCDSSNPNQLWFEVPDF